MKGISTGRALGLVMMAALGLLSGCVVNPYVRSSSVPVRPDSSTLCSGWRDTPVDEAHALEYATCLRRVMEDKASRHALMNNGGAPLLLGVAGLAAYRGFQGGHEANIAALTTGGAAIYGAQQYLYRAPREGIYLAGAGALACAVNQTRRKLLIETEFEPVANLLNRHVAPEVRAIGPALANLDGLSDSIRVPGSCSSLASDIRAARSDEHRARLEAEDLGRRLELARLKLAQLSAAARTARIDLIAATDAITSTVNQQLVLQQPNPADLAALLTRLKLPAMSPPATEPEAEAVNGVALPAIREPASMAAPESEPKVNCALYATEVRLYERAVAGLRQAVDRASADMAAVEGSLRKMEDRIGKQGADTDSMQLCYRPPSMSLLPFSLALAQPGAQTMPDDGVLLIPISGGTPPFTVVATDAQLTGTAEADNAGGYRLKIVNKDAEAGAHTMIATDGAGVTRIFQVQIAAQ